jgi:broad specificity phosphatase PhoE
MSVYIIRHAESQSNELNIASGCYDNPNLSRKGYVQAANLPSKLENIVENKKIIILSSPSTRARETIEPFAQKYSTFVKTLYELKECDLGRVDQASLADIDKKQRELFPGSEPDRSVYQRAIYVADQISDAAEKVYLLVTHGIFSRYLIHTLDETQPIFENIPEIDNADPIKIEKLNNNFKYQNYQ